MDGLWFIVIVVGPVLLLAAIMFATLRVRRRNRDQDATSERATRELREEIEADDHRL